MDDLFVKMVFKVGTEGSEEGHHLDVVDQGVGAACEKALCQRYA